MRTNENAVRFYLEYINSVPFKRRQKLHDNNWDTSLLDNHKVRKMTTQELAKKLVFGETHIDECGRVYTIYKWHFNNLNSWGCDERGKQGVTKACEYWLRRKYTDPLGSI